MTRVQLDNQRIYRVKLTFLALDWLLRDLIVAASVQGML